MKIKVMLALLFMHISAVAYGNDRFALETGLGVDYAGIGTQVYLPLGIDRVDIYLAAGLFYASSDNTKEMGVGAGANFFISKHNAVALYLGTMNVDKYIDDNLEINTQSDFGVSLGYKYYFNTPTKAGFTLAINYNIYNDGSYPFLSIGYRY